MLLQLKALSFRARRMPALQSLVTSDGAGSFWWYGTINVSNYKELTLYYRRVSIDGLKELAKDVKVLNYVRH
jgi:hypothetical protein